MARVEGKARVQIKVNKANMKAFEDSYRPDSQTQRDDDWRPWHADSMTHTRGNSYRPGQCSNNLGQGDSYRPGYSSYRDSYRPGQDFNNEFQSDTYRPCYESTTQTTSPTYSDATMVCAPQVDYGITAFREPVPPPPYRATAAMDVDMNILLLNAGNLTIDREVSPKSIVALTRELIVRGLPLELADLYASDKVPMIPVHKILPRNRGSINHCHKAQCKKCGKLQPRDIGNKKAQSKRFHTCSPSAADMFGTLLETYGWHQAFKDLDTTGWLLGPGPHDEKYSAQFLGPELIHAAQLANRNFKDFIATFTYKGPPSSPSSTRATHGAPAKAKSDPTNSRPKKTKAEKRKAKKALAQAQQQENKSNPDGLAQVQARARAMILPWTGKQTETAQTVMTVTKATVRRPIMPQHALPTFDINHLEKQIDSLSLGRL